MKLGRGMKILIGLVSCWPLLYMFIFMAGMFLFFDDPPFDRLIPFRLFFRIHMMTVLWIFALSAYYIIYIFRTDRVPAGKKALWAVVIVLGYVIAMPVFWYLYVWRTEDAGKKPTEADA